MKINVKSLSVLLISLFFLSGCIDPFKSKTEEEVITSVSQSILMPIQQEILKIIKEIPTIYEDNIDLNVEFLNSPSESLKLENASLDFSITSSADETDFSKYKEKDIISLSTKGNTIFQGKDTSWQGETDANIYVMENNIWFNLNKASIESSFLPIAFTATSSLTNKWYKISFTEIDKEVNKFISNSGLNDFSNFSILEQIKNKSANKIKKDLEFINSLLNDKSLLVSKNTTEILAKKTEDKKHYLVDVKLDNQQLTKILNKISVKIKEQTKNNSKIDNILELVINNLELIDLSGKLTVDTKNNENFKFEGTYITPDSRETISILIDTLTPDNLIIKLLNDKKQGLSFTKIDKNIILDVYEGGGEKFTLVSGTITKEKIDINVSGEEKDDKIAKLILNKDPKTNIFTGNLSLIENNLEIKINKLKISNQDFISELLFNFENKDIAKITLNRQIIPIKELIINKPNKVESINSEHLANILGDFFTETIIKNPFLNLNRNRIVPPVSIQINNNYPNNITKTSKHSNNPNLNYISNNNSLSLQEELKSCKVECELEEELDERQECNIDCNDDYKEDKLDCQEDFNDCQEECKECKDKTKTDFIECKLESKTDYSECKTDCNDEDDEYLNSCIKSCDSYFKSDETYCNTDRKRDNLYCKTDCDKCVNCN